MAAKLENDRLTIALTEAQAQIQGARAAATLQEAANIDAVEARMATHQVAETSC